MTERTVPGSPAALTKRSVVRWARFAAVAMTALIPLAVVPGGESPFSGPKLVAMAAWVAVGALVLMIAGINPLAGLDATVWWLVPGWIGLVSASALVNRDISIESLLLALLPAGAFLLLAGLRPDPAALLRAAAFSGWMVAVLALLQFFGWDPFRLLGWVGPAGASPRLRVFGTLGNPNFVAAFLVAALPATWAAGMLSAGKGRVLAILGGALLTGGIVASGSRAPALAAVSLAGWWLFWSRNRRFIPVLLLGAALAVWLSPARPLAETVRGRLYIWDVSLPHILESPWLGGGPGSFALRYPAWETARLAGGAPPDGAARFAGPQRHAHNDYLEILTDYGLAGLLLLGAIVAVALRRSVRAQKEGVDTAVAGAAAGVVVLLALAVVDFPLMRPAESFLFWVFLAIVLLPGDNGRQGRPVERSGSH